MNGVHFDVRAEGALLQLGGDLGIYTVAQLRQTLLAVLAEHPGRPIELDTQAVDEADSAGVQLLVATAHYVRQGGGQPVCGETSQGVEAVARRLGAADVRTFCGWDRKQESHHV